jgi:hypothetical protein
VFETVLESFFEDFVVAMVFTARIESVFPRGALLQLAPRNKFHSAVGNRNDAGGGHNECKPNRLTGSMGEEATNSNHKFLKLWRDFPRRFFVSSAVSLPQMPARDLADLR